MDDQPGKSTTGNRTTGKTTGNRTTGKTTTDSPDFSELSQTWSDIAERSQRLVAEFMTRQSMGGGGSTSSTGSMGMADPLNVGNAFLEMTTKMMADPAKMMNAQMSLWQDYMNLWQTTAARVMGQDDAGQSIDPERGDRRFRDEGWSENEVFNYIKQSYLLTSRWMTKTVGEVDGLDDHTAEKVDFYTRQFTDALSPSNFVMTNPEVLRATAESNGENLVNGLQNLLGDLERGAITMTDMDAFDVGLNVASTQGDVVFRNDLMELIQYAPSTDTVCQRPLLIIPPWINKFYILDLRPENSYIKWAVDQGHTVFVISWVNPDEKLADKSFDDYMMEGPVAALGAIEDATGEKQINAVGYCIGGTLLAATLAWMAADGETGKDGRIASATFLTTMVDFSEAGELGVFIDEEQLDSLQDKMDERGYLEGSEMATTFNMLRSNDLIWSFVVNNYLLGKDPFPFDLLYWNSDSTRMPADMHGYYLRKMYLENQLVEPGALELAGRPIDLTKIDTPSYLLSTRDDHIAPWKSTYAATGIYGGSTRFVLSASGHIAGVVNPPEAGKYCYWVNTTTTGNRTTGKAKFPKDPDKWLKSAKQTDGSWWPDWDGWLKKQSGKSTVDARQPGDGNLKTIEPAPGAYVRKQV